MDARLYYQKINRKRIKKFIQFLIRNKAYNNFVSELNRQSGLTLKDLIERKFIWEEAYRYNEIIDTYLTWHMTSQGVSYWRDLQGKWEQCVQHVCRNFQ